jgi:hypothetical protein
MEYDVALQAKASDRRPFGVGRRKASAATLAATLCCLSLDGCAAGRTAVKIAASHTQVTPTTLAVTTTSKATQSRRQGRVSWGPSAGLTDVSCWGQTCVAGGSSTAMRTGDPVAARALYSTDAGAVWQIATLPSDLTDLDAADCVSVTRCLAIGQVSGGSTADSLCYEEQRWRKLGRRTVADSRQGGRVLDGLWQHVLVRGGCLHVLTAA